MQSIYITILDQFWLNIDLDIGAIFIQWTVLLALNLLTKLCLPSPSFSPFHSLCASLLKFRCTVSHTDAATIPDAGPNVREIRKLKLFPWIVTSRYYSQSRWFSFLILLSFFFFRFHFIRRCFFPSWRKRERESRISRLLSQLALLRRGLEIQFARYAK